MKARAVLKLVYDGALLEKSSVRRKNTGDFCHGKLPEAYKIIM